MNIINHSEACCMQRLVGNYSFAIYKLQFCTSSCQNHNNKQDNVTLTQYILSNIIAQWHFAARDKENGKFYMKYSDRKREEKKGVKEIYHMLKNN